MKRAFNMKYKPFFTKHLSLTAGDDEAHLNSLKFLL